MPLTRIETQLLRRFFPRQLDAGANYVRNIPLDKVMGPSFMQRIQNKSVIDFGCGYGDDTVAMAKAGASHVIGLDIREGVLRVARQKANGTTNVSFATQADRHGADVIVCVDSFEHFSDPAAILRDMVGMLKRGGEVLISFGWTWYHPNGGHLFSVFPWAHLILSERALIEWRSDFKRDGAKRFSEVEGGLNKMTIRRFEKLVDESPFRLAGMDLVPIRPLRRFHNRLTREFTTACVRCRLVLH